MNNLQKIINIAYDGYLYFKKYQGAPKDIDLTGFIPFEEIAGDVEVLFEERKPKVFTQRFQISSLSCVAQTMAKMLEVYVFIRTGIIKVFTAQPCYKERSNAPAGGMIPWDALNFPKKRGVELESKIPSQNMTEAQMNSATYDDSTFEKIEVVPVSVPLDFYSVAKAIKQYGAVMVFMKDSYSGWCRDVPTGASKSEDFRHSIAGVDNISFQNKNYVVIEDSAGTWIKTSQIPLGAGQRAITEEYFKSHFYFAGTWASFEYTESKILKKDKFKFTKPMVFGEQSDDVRQMQILLQKLGLFPSNIPTTGRYLEATRKAVKSFQIKYAVDNMAVINNLNGKRAGDKTIAKLNAIQ